MGLGFLDELLGSIRIRNGVLRRWCLKFQAGTVVFVLRALNVSLLDLLTGYLKALVLMLGLGSQLLNRLRVNLLQRHDHAGATRT